MGRRWTAVLAAAILAWVGLQAGASAQEGPSPQITVDAVDSEQFPDVKITVTVRDSSGVPVSDVPLSAFTLSAGEEKLELTGAVTATNEEGGVSVVLAFDVSGSMDGLPLETAKAAGKSLIAQLGASDLVAVLAFGDTVRTVQPFTSDPALLAAAIDGLVASGNTALYQAVAESAALAKSSDSPRRAVVLLSDGTDYGGLSGTSREASLDAARSAGAPVFAVGLGGLIDEEYLSSLSAVTSGALSSAPTPDSLEGLYRSIGEVLRRQHLISFDASPIEAATNLRLAVEYGGARAATEFAFEPPPIPVEPVDEPVPQEPDPAAAVEEPETGVAATPGAAVVEPAPTASGSSSLLLVVGVGSPTLLAGAGLLTFVFVRRRRGRAAIGNLPEATLSALLRRSSVAESGAKEAAGEPAASGEATGARPTALALLKVPSKGSDSSYPIDGSPMTIGFPPDCDVQLPANGAERYERVRLWQRDGRFMLHNLSRGGTVTVAGKPVSWLVLEDGDAINIGGCQVLFCSS